MILSPADQTRRWLSVRVRLFCLATFALGSLLPPYVPKAALAPPESTIGQQQFLLVEDGFLMKSSSLTQRGARRAYSKGIVHVVKEGESVEALANRYSISSNTIKWANNIQEGTVIQPGDELIILPVDGVLHTVKRGQSLFGIAELYDVNPTDIVAQNNLQSEFLIAGQQVIIPEGTPIIAKPTVVARTNLPSSTQPAVPSQPTPSQPAPVITPTQPSEQIAEADITSGVLQKPCSTDCFITQYFHSSHFAIDMQERGGGHIYAAEAGTVIRAEYGWNGGFGNVIEVDHGNELVTLYGHNKTLYVKEGDTVQRGQIISEMGNSGLVYGATGIHVHFEVRLKGVKKNPLLYIQ